MSMAKSGQYCAWNVYALSGQSGKQQLTSRFARRSINLAYHGMRAKDSSLKSL